MTYEEQLLKAMEDMEHNIKNGAVISFVERFRPYSNLYNYNMMKLQNKLEDDDNTRRNTTGINS